MRATDRLAALITTYSTHAIVVMLVATAIIGAGMGQVDQSPGLDQFEFETEEGDALEYIGENFEVDDNETAVQIVIRDQDDALSRDSFLATLELQDAIETDPDIAPTLAEEPFSDLASIVGTEAIRAERADELEADQEAIENESAALNESQGELEADAAELEADAQELEERQASLEADEQDLENRTGILQSALEETVGLQTQYEAGELTEAEADAAIAETWTEAQDAADLDEEQNATFEAVGTDVREVASLEFEREAAIEAGPAEITDDPDEQGILRDALNETIDLQTAYDEAETEEERAEINATIQETWDAASENATLSSQQDAAFRDLGGDVRELTATINEIGPMPALFEAGTAGVLADEIADLEERGAELEADASELEEREQDIEERGDELEARGEELEARADQLAEDFEDLMEIDPTRDEQLEQLESMSDDEVDEFVAELLGPDAGQGLFVFVPTDFDPGDSETDARTLFVSQTTDEEELIEGDAPERIVNSQLAIDDRVTDQFGEDGFTFGVGVITDEINRSMEDSLGLVLPLAFLFVIVVLSIAYRDPLDIILGLAGIALVLVWTFGFVGWTGIVFNQIMIAVPVLLVGLSIDYAIHVFMRHRERRAEDGRDTGRAMRIVLLGLGAALVWVTITAVIGFLSNLVSPVAPIREFGIVSAFGILATLLIFGILIPATKITLDSVLEARGWDRRKRAFGTGGGRLTAVLNTGNNLADRIPVGVLVIALLLTAGGVYGGMQVDTEFNQEDFIADEPSPWMNALPAGIAPGDYSVKSNLDFVNERFIRQDTQTQVLIQGEVTADDTLEQIDAAATAAADESVVLVLSDGDADVHSPLSSMQALADEDPDFNETFSAADTTGDDVPDQNLTAVYDAYFDAAPDEANRFLHRTDNGDYEAARMTMSIRGDASPGEATTATRNVAAASENEQLSAIATGQLVVFHIIEDSLFESVLESLLVTMIAVFAFLMVAYRLVHGSAILGAVTLTPIILGVAWILGTMYLLDIPFNVITGTITSLTIGLGVAYNIHISERYRLELGNGNDAYGAMERAVTGTGGALLGSAATTIGGFGVLIFAILPPLQQFGLITALTILYAFLGSVFVLPSLLRLWSRWIHPEPATTQ